MSRGAAYAHADPGEPLVADRRREVLRAGASASLARGRPLPALRQRSRWPATAGTTPSRTGSATAARRAGRFDDLTGTVLAGHHQPLRVWVLCLYFMGLNLSNRQIAQELDLSQPDVQAMTEQLRPAWPPRLPAVVLDGEVEIDEVYVVAGHKGKPAAVAKRGARVGAGG